VREQFELVSPDVGNFANRRGIITGSIDSPTSILYTHWNWLRTTIRI